MSRRSLLLLGFLAFVAVVVLVTWQLTAPEREITFKPLPASRRPAQAGSPQTTPSPAIPSRTPAPETRAIDPEIQKLADRLVEQSQTPQNDLETVGEFVDLYRKVFSHLPVGSNEDMIAILTGHNPRQGVLFPPDSPMIVQGQLVDRWGTPYWLHPNSGARLEIRSAGPDKNLFTADDLTLNPSPAGLGVTPEGIAP